MTGADMLAPRVEHGHRLADRAGQSPVSHGRLPECRTTQGPADRPFEQAARPEQLTPRCAAAMQDAGLPAQDEAANFGARNASSVSSVEPCIANTKFLVAPIEGKRAGPEFRRAFGQIELTLTSRAVQHQI